MEWDLQTYLRDMRQEQQEDHLRLSVKIDSVVTVLNKHDKRIATVENTRKTMLWLGSSLIVAVIGFIVDMLVNHLQAHVAAASIVLKP